MPYSKISELPDQVKVLPEEAQRQFLRVVNSATDRGDDEETAFAKAWGAIKRGYEKNKDGEWVAKMTDEPELLVELGEGMDGGWRLYMPFKVIHHGIRKDFTINDGIEMVSNFKQSVPDYDLPINTLHRDEFGVYGTIADLRVSERGVEWLPAFRDGAVEELVKKGYKYASPEVQFNGYVGVFDGKEYKNVALGIALTPRPRLGRDTLVFSDGEWQEYTEEYSASDEVQEMHRFAFEFPQFRKWAEEKIAAIEKAFEQPPAAEMLSDENNEKEQAMDEQEKVNVQADDTRLQEKDAEITALQEEKARLQEEQEQMKVKLAEFEAAKAEAERVALEEKLARRKLEFAETAKQFSTIPEDGFGDELMWLNDADTTEGKAHYEKFMNVLRALVNQEKTAALFSEAGHEGSGAKTPEERFEMKVKEAMSEGLSRADAIAKAAKENGALYAEYDAAVTKTLNE